MADVELISKKRLNAGTHTYGPYTPPSEASHIKLVVDRTELLSSVVLSWRAEISFDAGNAWQSFVGASAIGGEVIDPTTGLPSVVSTVERDLPGVGSADRRLRGDLTLNEAARLSLILTIT